MKLHSFIVVYYCFIVLLLSIVYYSIAEEIEEI